MVSVPKKQAVQALKQAVSFIKSERESNNCLGDMLNYI